MTALAKARELVERWRELAKGNYARGFFSVGQAQEQCAADLSALLPELERVEQERDRAFEALHPGKMPALRNHLNEVLHPQGSERLPSGAWFPKARTDTAADIWCYDANLYERVTGKRIGDEG